MIPETETVFSLDGMNMVANFSGKKQKRMGEMDGDGTRVDLVTVLKEDADEAFALCDAIKMKMHSVLEKVAAVQEIQEFYGEKSQRTLDTMEVSKTENTYQSLHQLVVALHCFNMMFFFGDGESMPGSQN